MDHSVPQEANGKGKAKLCHMIYASAKESDSDGSSLFNTDDEEVLTAEVRTQLTIGTPRQRRFDDVGGVPSNSRRDLFKKYSFKEEHASSLFELLNRNNKLRLIAT